MIFIETLQLECYAVPERPRPGIPYINVLYVSQVQIATKVDSFILDLKSLFLKILSDFFSKNTNVYLCLSNK